MKKPDYDGFANRNVRIIGEDQLRKFAVLVPIIETQDGRSLVFEKRSDTLRRQPGEICFPGGRLENDEKPEACAGRETSEELCVKASQIKIRGPGDIFVSPVSDIIIYPFIGELKNYSGTFNTDEVAEVVSVPIEFFLKNPPEKYKSAIITQQPDDFPFERIPGGENYPWERGWHEVLFYQYGDHLIWGITAHLVRSAVGLIDAYGLG